MREYYDDHHANKTIFFVCKYHICIYKYYYTLLSSITAFLFSVSHVRYRDGL